MKPSGLTRTRERSEVVTAVRALTRRDDQTPEKYYAAVAADALARRVKHADLADNSDPRRLAVLEADDPATAARLRAKYAHAAAELARLSGDEADAAGSAGR